MIDAETRYPYLIRNYLNRIVGYNGNARKPIDIDKYYEQKKKISNDEEIVDFGLQLKEDEDQQNLDNLDENYYKEIGKIEKTEKRNRKNLCVDYESYQEVDFPFFEKSFWSSARQRNTIWICFRRRRRSCCDANTNFKLGGALAATHFTPLERNYSGPLRLHSHGPHYQPHVSSHHPISNSFYHP